MLDLSETIIEKFWANVEKTDTCWNWIGYLNRSNKPIIRDGTDNYCKEFNASRMSLKLDGKIISKSEHVQPLICRNKLCVNPQHLVYGDEARFWAKVHKLNEPDGCWVWIAGQTKDMYGKFSIYKDKKCIDIRAHHYSWQLHIGRPVPKSMVICHKCDKPYCVNPTHLFIGTTQDNTKDRDNKNRQAKGEKINFAKLTAKEVKEIRELYLLKLYTIQQLSNSYGISYSSIAKIIRKETWKHI